MTFNQLTLILFCLLSFSSIGQQKQNYQEVGTEQTLEPQKNLSELFFAIEGTYEVAISQPNYHILRTQELYDAIEDARTEHSNAVLQWDVYTTITVFPKLGTDTDESLNPN